MSNPNFIDLTGQRFGSLLVVERAPNYASGAARWKCVCDCGKTIIAPSNNLRQGYQKGCGGKHPKRDNLIGLRFGRLVVEESLGANKRRAQIVRAKCDCGGEWTGEASSLRRLNTKSCGCLPTNKRRSDREQVALNRVHKAYRGSARKRGHTWDLTEEQFFALIRQDCHYCGTPPSCVIKSKADAEALYNGVDRQDNSRGYVPDNVVPCCRICNLAKRALTPEQFLAQIERIYNHSIAKQCVPTLQLDSGLETRAKEASSMPSSGDITSPSSSDTQVAPSVLTQ